MSHHIIQARARNGKSGRRYDMSTDAIDVPQNVIVPEPEDRPAEIGEPAIANRISHLPGVLAMLRAIEFDDKFLQRARKIDDVSGDRQPPPEGKAH